MRTLLILALVLVSRIVSLPQVPDGLNRPIPRPANFAQVISEVADEMGSDDAEKVWLASALDVIAAHESGYRQYARGDGKCFYPDGTWVAKAWNHDCPNGTSVKFGSCGAWQTPCSETPMPEGRHQTTEIGKAQARVAVKWLLWSKQKCPAFPISLYATGRTCGSVNVANLYSRQIQAELDQLR